jgi:O-antigen/teichoic acid export membrane protein
MQWLSNLGSSLFGYLDRIIVNFFLGPSAAGIYAATTAVVSRINQLSAMPLQALPTWISAANALFKTERIRQIFIRATRLNGLIVFLIAAPIMFWSQPLAGFLVGAAYSAEASQLLLHLSLIYGLYSLAGAGFYTAIGVGSPRINAMAGITSGSLVILALAIFAPNLGLMGAAWANALYILVLIINSKVKSLINLDTREYIVHFAPAVIALLVCWFVSSFFYYSQWTMTLKAPIFIVAGAIAVIFVGSWGFLKEIVSTPLDIVMKWKSGRVS